VLPGEAFNSVVNRKNMDTLAVLHIGAGVNAHNVTHANPKVVSHNFVHANLLVGAVVITQDDTDLK
jgi:hypothetical protein